MPLFLFNTENIKPNIQMMSLKVQYNTISYYMNIYYIFTYMFYLKQIIFDLIMRHGFRAFEDVVIVSGILKFKIHNYMIF